MGKSTDIARLIRAIGGTGGSRVFTAEVTKTDEGAATCAVSCQGVEIEGCSFSCGFGGDGRKAFVPKEGSVALCCDLYGDLSDVRIIDSGEVERLAIGKSREKAPKGEYIADQIEKVSQRLDDLYSAILNGTYNAAYETGMTAVKAALQSLDATHPSVDVDRGKALSELVEYE